MIYMYSWLFLIPPSLEAYVRKRKKVKLNLWFTQGWLFLFGQVWKLQEREKKLNIKFMIYKVDCCALSYHLACTRKKILN